MRRKGVSPIVAVVILVGIAVMTGGLLSSWISSFISGSSEQETCAITTMYTLSDATYNATSGEIKLRLKNTGSVDLYNFTIEADNGTDISLVPATSPSPSYVLGSGGTQYVLGNGSLHNITNVASITVMTESCSSYSPSSVKVENI